MSIITKIDAAKLLTDIRRDRKRRDDVATLQTALAGMPLRGNRNAPDIKGINFCRNCRLAVAVIFGGGDGDEYRCAGCGERICRFCGCTDSAACFDETGTETCGWAEAGVCTECICLKDI